MIVFISLKTLQVSINPNDFLLKAQSTGTPLLLPLKFFLITLNCCKHLFKLLWDLWVLQRL